jgi:hypothetical protein
MAYGKNKYKLTTTAEGFYDAYSTIDVANMIREVRSMKYRKIWKDIIKDISENDAEVNIWLKDQPK